MIMKRCPCCKKSYGDWRENCPDCGGSLIRIDSGETEIEKRIRENQKSYQKKKRILRLAQAALLLLLSIMLCRIGVGFGLQNAENHMKAAVEEYDIQGQHADVLRQMKEQKDFVSTRPVLQEIWDRNAEPYRAEVFREARLLFETKGYSDATDVLYEARNVLGEDEELEAEIKRYSHSRPDVLIRLKPKAQGECVYVGPEEFGQFSEFWLEMDYDRSGSSFDNTDIHFITAEDADADSAESRSITYSLGKYSAWLTGYVYVPEFTRHCEIDWHTSGVVMIYGDGELLYTQSLAQDTAEAVGFRLWVGDVDKLKIELRGMWLDRDFDDGRYYPMICLSRLRLERFPFE